MPARERKGPAPARKPMRRAERSRPAASALPRSVGSGASKVAVLTFSRAGKRAATSSSLPPKGRSASMTVALSGSTTHSRPRAETKEPGAYVVVMGVGDLASSRGKSVQGVDGVPGRRWFRADLRGLYFGDLVPVVNFGVEL